MDVRRLLSGDTVWSDPDRPIVLKNVIGRRGSVDKRFIKMLTYTENKHFPLTQTLLKTFNSKLSTLIKATRPRPKAQEEII